MLIEDGLNFEDLLIRIAEEAGVARMPQDDTETIGIPEDAHELDRCKRAANDAISDLQRAYPKWKCLRRYVQITFLTAGTSAQNVGGAAGRMRLSNSYQLIPQGNWTVRSTGASPNRSSPLSIRLLSEVAALQTTDPNVGEMPRMMGVGPVENVGDARNVRLGSEMRIWPVPSIDVVVEGMCRVRVAKLVELGDLCPFGSQHDRTILKFAMRVLKRTDPDLQVRAWHEQDCKSALMESIALDNEEALPTLGRAYDGSESGEGEPYHGEQVYINGDLMTSGS